jgi:hypothetical protein
MTETIRAIIMTAAALAPLGAWLVVPGITFARLTGLAVCAVVVVGVVLAVPVPHDDDDEHGDR